MPRMIPTLFTLAIVASLFAFEPAFAYVGPGSGLGAIGALLGLLGTLFLALLSFIWYPFKRLYRSMRRSAKRRRSGTA